jgi:hypothetical protein
VETTTGTSSATAFPKAVFVDLGTGTDQFNIASNGNPPDGRQVVVARGTFVAKAGLPGFSIGEVVLPNGGSIQT